MKRREPRLVTTIALWAGLGMLAPAQIPMPPVATSPAPEPIWQVPGEGWGRPAVDAGTVYFLSKRHEVVAIDAATARVRWRQGTGEPGERTFGSSVVVSGGVVAAGDYNVIAFDRETGAVRWRFAPNDGYGPGIYLGAAAGGQIFTGSPAGRLYAVDERTGAARWSAAVSLEGNTTVFAPAVDGDLVAAGYSTWVAPNTGGIVAVDAASGRERWRASFPRPDDPTLSTMWGGGPVFADDVVVATSGDGTIHAFERGSGAIRWSIPRLSGRLEGTGVSPDRDFRALAFARAARLLVAGSLTGYLAAYDLDTRQERWRHTPLLYASVAFELTIDDRQIYAPYFSGTLIAVDLADGLERWRVGDWRQGFYWPAVVDGDRLYVSASTDGFLAFDRFGRSLEAQR